MLWGIKVPVRAGQALQPGCSRWSRERASFSRSRTGEGTWEKGPTLGNALDCKSLDTESCCKPFGKLWGEATLAGPKAHLLP